jgi:hypothetical protein
MAVIIVENEIKKEILKIIKKEPVWLSEIYRELIKRGYKPTWANFLEIIKELEEEKTIKSEVKGPMKFVWCEK